MDGLGRDAENCGILNDNLRALGFNILLSNHMQVPIIVTVHMPAAPKFEFTLFDDRPKIHSYVIDLGELSVAAIRDILCKLGVRRCEPAQAA